MGSRLRIQVVRSDVGRTLPLQFDIVITSVVLKTARAMLMCPSSHLDESTP